uniref:Uncharacterized protein n=1 Tax=Craspedostauros australis TaxID=1486917 RepID=A0A6T6GGV2_9STRA|mmetsp:Transcript_24581/g.68528  ORF Transcript_24581/g.68528 Transcript_24581/m.68528 type:complete len:154 (+) Transcript_24581:407-868(+)
MDPFTSFIFISSEPTRFIEVRKAYRRISRAFSHQANRKFNIWIPHLSLPNPAKSSTHRRAIKGSDHRTQQSHSTYAAVHRHIPLRATRPLFGRADVIEGDQRASTTQFVLGIRCQIPIGFVHEQFYCMYQVASSYDDADDQDVLVCHTALFRE